MSEVLDLIQRLEQATSDAKEALRELHGATKDTKAVLKEARETIRLLGREEVQTRLNGEVKRQVDALEVQIRRHVEVSARKVEIAFEQALAEAMAKDLRALIVEAAIVPPDVPLPGIDTRKHD